MPVAPVAHVHEGRKGSPHGNGHFVVKVVDGRVEKANVRGVLGLDVMVVVMVGQVMSCP